MRPILFIAILVPSVCLADDLIYRYEGDVLPNDPSAGWQVFNPCEPPCSESVENGRLVLHWTEADDLVNYTYVITKPPEPPLPTLWVEWRFRSNHPIPPNFFGCDASMNVRFDKMIQRINMYGDAVVSASGDDFVWHLPNGEWRTYRFESPDGLNYWFSVDGQIFLVDSNVHETDLSYLQMVGFGGCVGDQIPDMVNEWDYVRFGTLASGEEIVAATPPAGFVDARKFAPLDHFTVTFDAPNYVYLDEIEVESRGGVAPMVTKTRRMENGGPETVEFVLDRPLPIGATTRFTFDDGATVNVLEYTFAPGDTDGDGDADLHDAAAFQCCFGQAALAGQCLVLDADGSGTVDLSDYAYWHGLVESSP